MRLFILCACGLLLSTHGISAKTLISEAPVMLMAQACHPSYEGECVPITSDADCASGSGMALPMFAGRSASSGPTNMA